MDAIVRLGKIHIIEWLEPTDRKTGGELWDELEPMGIGLEPQIPVAFYSITTRVEFVALLRVIEDDFRATNRVPLLHIETHGNDDGIGVSGTEGFTFFELKEELIPLNRLTGLRLIVVLAACEGMWGIKMLQPAERAAFLAILGPNRTLLPSELLRANLAFYRTLLRTRNGNAAFMAMNDSIDPTKKTFGMANAEMLFRMIYQAFLKDERCSEQGIAKRVEAMIAQATADFRVTRGVGMWASEVDHLRTVFRQGLEDHDKYFEQFRREYFLIDLFPENDRRFPITIEDCRVERVDDTEAAGA